MAQETPMTTADGWDATTYDERTSFVYEYGFDVLDLLDPAADERVLDLGCGIGHLSATIADAGADVVGIDSSPKMIERAREPHDGVDFRCADARTDSGQPCTTATPGRQTTGDCGSRRTSIDSSSRASPRRW
jgi:trans-aconitate methyltransferase